MGTLNVDFYESGVGDTIIVTFPGGGIGLIDACPSPLGTRPPIEKLIAKKEVHFVCLTHPHEDHAEDLLSAVKTAKPKEFWHPLSDVPAFAYKLEQFVNFPSPVQDLVKRINEKRAALFIDLLGTISEDEAINLVHAHSGLAARNIDGVDLHFLSPDEDIINEFRRSYFTKFQDLKAKEPDFNLLSVILALHFAGNVVLLGSDALKRNWFSAFKLYRRRNLPLASVLKVPHHGASNSFDFQKGPTYLDLCSSSSRAQAILFGGDRKHPHQRVFEKLKAKTEVCCLANGLKTPAVSNPFGIAIPSARSAAASFVCNPSIGFSIDSSGTLSRRSGNICAMCV